MQHPVDRILAERKREQLEAQARSDNALRKIHQQFQSSYVDDMVEFAKTQLLDHVLDGGETIEAMNARLLAEEQLATARANWEQNQKLSAEYAAQRELARHPTGGMLNFIP